MPQWGLEGKTGGLKEADEEGAREGFRGVGKRVWGANGIVHAILGGNTIRGEPSSKYKATGTSIP